MTIKIEIEAHPDRGDMAAQINRSMSALGFFRTPVVSHLSHGKEAPLTDVQRSVKDGTFGVRSATDEERAAVGIETPQTKPADLEREHREDRDEADAPTLDTRLVGAPAEGNKRRNSAEKAEDDELEALAFDKAIPVEKLNAVIARVGRVAAKAELETLERREKQVAETPAISTGENRVGPKDDPETAEQDAADEAAETEQAGLARIDVLRRLVGDYQKKHGMPAAVKLCQDGGLIGKPIHELDEAGIEAAIAAMQGVGETETLSKREEPVEEAAPKTKADLVEAMMRYGDKYDGTREQAKMTHTLADCPRIFADLFGPEVTKLSQVPADGYARAVAAIEAAIEADPYGRAK